MNQDQPMNIGERTMRIGNQTACWVPEILLPFHFAVQHGFRAFEWFPDRDHFGHGWDESSLPEQFRRQIRRTAGEHDITLSVHSPLSADPLEPGGVEAVLSSVEFARDLGATLVNVHLRLDQGTEPFLQAIRPLAEATWAAGISLSFENTPMTHPEQINRFFARMHQTSSNSLNTSGQITPNRFQTGLCLDVGHANLCNSTRNDYLRFIDLLDPEVPIVHVHLHENAGDHDSHLVVFTGPAKQDDRGIRGLIRRLRQRNFTGSFIMEQWPQPPEMLIEARDRLEKLWIDQTNPIDPHRY
jgi:sugar phosphate isomerase/epimerase